MTDTGIHAEHDSTSNVPPEQISDATNENDNTGSSMREAQPTQTVDEKATGEAETPKAMSNSGVSDTAAEQPSLEEQATQQTTWGDAATGETQESDAPETTASTTNGEPSTGKSEPPPAEAEESTTNDTPTTKKSTTKKSSKKTSKKTNPSKATSSPPTRPAAQQSIIDNILGLSSSTPQQQRQQQPEPAFASPDQQKLWNDLLSDAGWSTSDFDAPALQRLTKMSDEEIAEVVESFRVEGFQNIRNKNRFLLAAFRRVKEKKKEHELDTVELADDVKELLEKVMKDQSVDRDAFHDKAVVLLKGMSRENGMEVLSKFGEIKPGSVNNHVGFFMGIVKRFKKAQKVVSSDASPTDAAFSKLSKKVRAILTDAFHNKAFSKHAISASCYEALAALKDDQAVDATRRMVRTDVSNIRNVNGYFEGIIRRQKQLASVSPRGNDRSPRGNDRRHRGGSGHHHHHGGSHRDRRGDGRKRRRSRSRSRDRVRVKRHPNDVNFNMGGYGQPSAYGVPPARAMDGYGAPPARQMDGYGYPPQPFPPGVGGQSSYAAPPPHHGGPPPPHHGGPPPPHRGAGSPHRGGSPYRQPPHQHHRRRGPSPGGMRDERPTKPGRIKRGGQVFNLDTNYGSHTY